ncbi:MULTISPECIES: OmpA family protein [unclassified Devosia]|uniref:OmpA family protein n=1 Tax=unclassified Devosia TaxID=196773 RepID=UPI0015536B12|nr:MULTISPECIES: OmpA family protein [unclassified Devosia]
MRIRNWLLTSTSLGLLAVAPLSVSAQESVAPAELPQACVDAGFSTLESCIAAQPAGADAEAAPDEEEAPAADEATEEAPAEEPAVVDEAPAEEPAVEEEAPAEEPAAVEEAPAEEPEVETEAVEEPSVDEEAAEEETVDETVTTQEAEPEAEPAAAEDTAPAAEEPAAEEETVVPEEPATAEEPAAEQTTETGEEPAATTETGEQPATEQPAETAPELTTPETTTTEQPATSESIETLSAEEPAEVIEDLPEGVTQEQVAPVLDSAKDAETAPVEGQAAPETAAQPAVAEEPAAPPPTSDADAQARLAVPEEAAVLAVREEQGQVIEAQALPAQQVPQNVTVVNQTNVVNNVTNNTTNNTAIDNSTNIGQQNNVQQNNVQQNNVQQTNYGDTLTQVVVELGNQLYVNTPGQDTSRFYNANEDEVFYEELRNGRIRETVTRPDGTQIVTVRNRNGDVLQRTRIRPDGQEVVLAYFDEQYDDELLEWRDPGQDLPPLRLNIPVQEYVLDAADADEEQVEVFFRQPPVEQVARLYSIDEVKRSARVRDSVRKLEVGGLTFDTGAATISQDQVGSLSKVAAAMLDLLESNPAETFLIEGHTDAVGSDISNLQLSDLRAATVARILTDFYDVPPENLATQGYGERYLKIRTEAPERENRRVTIRRITPLITVANK